MLDKNNIRTLNNLNGVVIYGAYTSGHDFIEIEKTEKTQILVCKICGVKSVGNF